jgi:hypothetical protein
MESAEITLSDIRQGVLAEIERFLACELATARNASKERISTFVSQKAPRYRPLLSRFDEAKLVADPTVSDRELELQLHRQLQDIEHEIIADGHIILSGSGGSWEDESYVEQVHEYMDKVEDLKMSDLAGYVSHRRVVLDILDGLLKVDPQGKYVREERVHSLLMPLRATSMDVGPEASNLWIIDERLAFHDYLASDKTFRSMPVTGSDSTKEPDIMALRLNNPMLVSENEHMPLASIVVVEIKRPMRNDATDDDKNPISQALDYLERVREGGLRTAAGRPIPKSESVPGFCYVIADLTPTMISRCKDADLRPTSDGLGYFGFNNPRGAYVEVISFDRLINAATERNRAFFDKLGLPAI